MRLTLKEDIIKIECIELGKNSKNLTKGRIYNVINSEDQGNYITHNFKDDLDNHRNLSLISHKGVFRPIYKGENDIYNSKCTTSDIKGFFSLQDIKNILGKFEFDEEDLCNVINEFNKLIIKIQEKNEQIEIKYIEQEQEDNLPF